QAVIFQRAAGGTSWSRSVAYSPSDLQTGEQFGFAVAIHGDTAVIGGPGTPSGWTGASPPHANSRGRAFYARYSGSWPSSPVPLPAPVLTDGAYYGFAVDVQGDLVAIGALGMDGTRGRVYLNSYRAGGQWAAQPSLQPPGLAPTSWFGTGVSISGGRILAGAHGAGTGFAGRAYIFKTEAVDDASINVTASGLSVSAPLAEQMVAIRSVPGKEGFRIPVAGSLQRWDALDVPLPNPLPADGVYFPATFNVKYQLTLRNVTDNIMVPLVGNGTVTQSVTASAFNWTGSVRNAVVIPVSRTLMAVPQDHALILPNKNYSITVTVSHSDGASEVVDVTRTLSPLKLLSLNGSLTFGNVATSIISVTGNPAAGTVTPLNDTLFFLTLNLPAGGGQVTANPTQTFGGGPLTVLYDGTPGPGQGQLSMYGSETVQLAAGAAGSSTGVRWTRGPVVLSKNGAVAQNFRVQLPLGLGYSENSGGRLKGSAVVSVPLSPGLEPVGTVEIKNSVTGAGVAVVHEKLPVWTYVKYLAWNIGEGTFTGVSGFPGGEIEAVVVRNNAMRDLRLARQNFPLAEGDDGTRMSNDDYFGTEYNLVENLVFTVSPEGRALLNCRISTPQAHAGFKTHYPKGLAIPAGKTAMTWENSRIVSGTMTQTVPSAATSLTYATVTPDADGCLDPNSPLASRTVSFTAAGGLWKHTADGGLRAEGAIASAGIAWGLNPAGQYVHTVQGVTTGAMLTGGTGLSTNAYGPVANPGAGYLPAAMLLTGHGKRGDESLIERFGTKGYDPGLAANNAEFAAAGSADYPGFNFRAVNAGAPVLRATSRISGNSLPAYDLKPHSKYYLRRGGVTGVHDAVTAQISMPPFYGYAMNLSGLGLSYLDCANRESVIDGGIHLPFPSGLDLEFEDLTLTPMGELDRMELTSTGEPRLAYWNMDLKASSIEFATANQCAVAGRKLVLGVTGKMPALTDDPLQARLGFEPTGELVTGGQANGMPTDSRFTLPVSLSMKGVGGSRYLMTPVSRAALNQHDASGAPGMNQGGGFVSFAGALAVPFFDDIQVHVIASPSASSTQDSLFYLAGGWVENGRTFFNDVNFDASNRGFPPGDTGVSYEAYRTNTNPAYLPVARRNWQGIVDLDYPLKWSPVGRYFTGDGGDKDEILVLSVEHNLQKLTNEGCSITFGSGFETPQLSISSLAAEALTGGLRDALSQAEIDPVRMLDGIDGLERVLTDRFERMAGAMLENVLRDAAGELVDGLNSYYASRPVAPNRFSGLASVHLTEGRGSVVNQFKTIAAKGGAFNNELNAALDGAVDACNLALEIVGTSASRGKITEMVVKLSQVGGGTPVDGVGAEVMAQAEDGLLQAELLIREVRTQLITLKAKLNGASDIMNRLNEAFDNQGGQAVDLAIARIVAEYGGAHDPTGEYMSEFTTLEHQERVMAILKQSITGSTLASAVQPVLRGVFTEIRTQFRGAVDLVFAEVTRLLNRALRGLIDAASAAGQAEFEKLAGSSEGGAASAAAGVGDFC
ncbi:MAG: hypothetical protein JWL81_2730, partial [Verrucomicrobiales bacterium]|nr:hypothetical protein [Verrucomicrobiales bacterium]